MGLGRGLVVLCAGAALLVPLAACGNGAYEGGTEPGAGKSAEPPPTKSNAPSKPAKAPPGMPKGAKSHADPAGGFFMRHYAALYNFALETGNWTPLDALAEPGCKSCKNFHPAPPAKIEGGRWTPGIVSYGTDKDPYTLTVRMPIKSAEGKFFASEGAKPQVLKAESWTLEATLAWKGDSGWLIRKLTRQQG